MSAAAKHLPRQGDMGRLPDTLKRGLNTRVRLRDNKLVHIHKSHPAKFSPIIGQRMGKSEHLIVNFRAAAPVAQALRPRHNRQRLCWHSVSQNRDSLIC